MPSASRTTLTSKQIQAEIEQTFGFLPPFFEPALTAPQVLDNLWQQTCAAYVRNPLSALFKERLIALLSRFCATPYFMIVHSAALRPLGMTAHQVLVLLNKPPSVQQDIPPLGTLTAPAIEEAAAPTPDSPLESTLLYCAATVFLEQADAWACQLELLRLLGTDLYPHLITYLAYIKTCHTWIEAYPEVSYEADRRAQDNLAPLLAEEPALADFFGNYQARVREQSLGTERRRAADDTLRAEQARTAGILEGISDGFIALDRDWRFTYINDQAVRILFQTRSEVLGRLFWEIFPETVGTIFEHNCRRAVDEQVTVAFEEYFAPLDSWFEIRVYPSAGGISLFLQDITEHKGADAEHERLAERERFLAGLAERARTLTDPDEVVADALRSIGQFLGASRCVFVDIEADGAGGGQITIHPDYLTDGVTSMAGVFPISAFGQYVIDAYSEGRTVAVDDVRNDPLRVPKASRAAYESADIAAHIGAPVVHSARLVSCIGVHSPVPRHWMPEEVDLVQAVVERTWLTVEVLRQQRTLAHEAESTTRILASITDAFFTLDRDWRFLRINEQAERLMTRPRAQIMGLVFWEAFPALVGTQFEHEYRRAVNEGEAVTFQQFYAPLDAWLDVRAYPSEDGLSVFFQDISERKRAEAERERLLAEQQRRAEREALLNRIGQTIRNAQDPEAIQEAAVELLGEALGADRCYFALYDLGRGIVNISRDWHRVDLPSIQGEYPFANTVEMFRELYGDSNTSVVEDALVAPLSAQTRANMNQMQLRSRVSVALIEGESVMATLTAAMGRSRIWTQDEVALVEAVGTQLRTAVATARLAQREHNIATQLQSALQPDLPARVHDLSVGNFTRPALQEASVGGDFFDIFPLDKELYALVIGDVSGKGLAAAQQLALIRNSLRTALYLYHAPAQAVAAISAIVSSHDLLIGFVTAWVGIYDTATGQICYASCGHEPGMVKRAATGTVEILLTTGPPLGIAENAIYDEEHVTLRSGDALLLYTDGISEAGRNRRDLLGTAGLARLFEALPDGWGVQAEAEMLVAQVSDLAGGVFRDDVAVLLARRE